MVGAVCERAKGGTGWWCCICGFYGRYLKGAVNCQVNNLKCTIEGI